MTFNEQRARELIEIHESGALTYAEQDDAIRLLKAACEALTVRGVQPKPDGYAYRFPSVWGGTTLRFGDSSEYNGHKPIEAIPYYFAAPAVKAGYVPVPVEPTPGRLMSMAIRFDHAFGTPGYYDTLPIQWGPSHQERLRAALAQMRQLYEEATGQGFYRDDREEHYAGLIEAAPGGGWKPTDDLSPYDLGDAPGGGE